MKRWKFLAEIIVGATADAGGWWRWNAARATLNRATLAATLTTLGDLGKYLTFT